MEMASALLNTRTRQGSGKKVQDRSSYGKAGNPQEFMQMASELRRSLEQQGR
jgi:LPS sulfotransferase NodH